MLAMVYDHSGDSEVGTGLVIALFHLVVQQLETLHVIFDWFTLAHTHAPCLCTAFDKRAGRWGRE